MVRRLSVIRRLLLTLAALLLSAVTGATSEHVMVLIVSSDSPVNHLDVIEVRKLFLGLTIIRDDLSLRAYENRSDARLRAAFLQNVIAMPEGTYERRLMSITLQQGGRRPRVFTKSQELIDALAVDPSAVSFAWAEDVAQDKRVRALRVLWRD